MVIGCIGMQRIRFQNILRQDTPPPVRPILGVLIASIVGASAPSWAQSMAFPENSQIDGSMARALVKPRLETTLASRLSAPIVKISTREGARFKRGDRLVEFDCVVPKANLKKAQAELLRMNKVLVSRLRLERLNAVSELDLAIAKADVEKAKAEVAIMGADVDGCVIFAPFRGRVTEILAQSHEHVTPGQPVIGVLDDTAMRLEILAPAQWAVQLTVGSPLRVMIDETGRVYTAVVRSLGARVDPSSQTLQVHADIDEHDGSLLAGMSGTIRVGNRD